MDVGVFIIISALILVGVASWELRQATRARAEVETWRGVQGWLCMHLAAVYDVEEVAPGSGVTIDAIRAELDRFCDCEFCRQRRGWRV
ncbi:hypothetical protein C1Y63_10445 [Corynebacterium sp. 13CS0277]|nr:hypothetical protein C1Y63_10445 [Corynebacterium sp. 13CS0277]